MADKDDKTTCSFCGSTEQIMEARRHGYDETIGICAMCADKAGRLFGIKNNTATSSSTNSTAQTSVRTDIALPEGFKLLSPRQIYEQLSKYLVGQDRYCRALSIFGYSHCKRIVEYICGTPEDELPKKMNMVIIGSTGCGKTYGIERLSKIVGVPYTIFDSSKCTQAGYVGNDVGDAIRNLIISCGGNIALSKAGICCYDEFDKLASRECHTRDVGGEGVQQALLRIFDGCTIEVPTTLTPKGSRDGECKLVSTNFISFIGSGAFVGIDKLLGKEERGRVDILGKSRILSNVGTGEEQDIEKALIEFGLIPEIVGRMQTRVLCNELEASDLKRVFTEPVDSILKTEVARYLREGISLIVVDSAVSAIAASAKNHSTGARGLLSIFKNLMEPVEFTNFGSQDGTVNEVVVYADKDNVLKVETKGKSKSKTVTAKAAAAL